MGSLEPFGRLPGYFECLSALLHPVAERGARSSRCRSASGSSTASAASTAAATAAAPAGASPRAVHSFSCCPVCAIRDPPHNTRRGGGGNDLTAHGCRCSPRCDGAWRWCGGRVLAVSGGEWAKVAFDLTRGDMRRYARGYRGDMRGESSAESWVREVKASPKR